MHAHSTLNEWDLDIFYPESGRVVSLGSDSGLVLDPSRCMIYVCNSSPKTLLHLLRCEQTSAPASPRQYPATTYLLRQGICIPTVRL
jgi:hypothetical protein